jgi:hypothetical protein
MSLGCNESPKSHASYPRSAHPQPLICNSQPLALAQKRIMISGRLPPALSATEQIEILSLSLGGRKEELRRPALAFRTSNFAFYYHRDPVDWLLSSDAPLCDPRGVVLAPGPPTGLRVRLRNQG